jgi:hypothetical protein
MIGLLAPGGSDAEFNVSNPEEWQKWFCSMKRLKKALLFLQER